MLVATSSRNAAAIENAKDLADKCEAVGKILHLEGRRIRIPNSPGALQCWGYIQAVQNFLVLVDKDRNRLLGACAPEKTTLQELINSFLAYMKQHPAERHGNAAVATIRAMQQTYPCRPE